MTDYLKHLESEYSKKTFKRKVDYIKFNFGHVISIFPKRASVLEIGPGMGEMVSYLNSFKITNIDVVDNDREILKLIEKKYKVKNVYLTNDILKTIKKLKTYDIIVLIQVLEHLPLIKQPKIINRLYSCLNVGGHILIVVPNANNPLGLVERYGDLQHTVSYTDQSLRDLINKAGINKFDIMISGFDIPPYGLINVVRIVLQKLLHFFLLLIMVINGGTFFKTMTPNLVLRMDKKE